MRTEAEIRDMVETIQMDLALSESNSTKFVGVSKEKVQIDLNAQLKILKWALGEYRGDL